MNRRSELGRRKIITGFLCLPIVSCASGGQTATGQPEPNLAELTYHAVDRLLRQMPKGGDNATFVVSSLTDTRYIDRSSAFGNLVADLVRSRLAQNHEVVAEVRLRETMQMKHDEGEIMLSRNKRDLVDPPRYGCIATGTYGVERTQVVVSLKAMSPLTGQIYSAVDFVVWRTPDINALL